MLRRVISQRWSVPVLFGLVGLGLTLPSCQNMPLVAPSGTALTLIPATQVLPVNGTTEITAVLIEGGQQDDGTGTGTVAAGTGTPVHNGTLVTFNTTLGRVEPAEVKTTNGRATVRLIGDGRSGTATITAFSGPATNSVDISVGAASAAFISLTASPQSLPATGGSAALTARVEDVQGNGVEGLSVTFSTTAGTLSETSVTTDATGSARTTLTTTQEAEVTATTGAASAPLSETVTVVLRPRTAVTITAPASATVGVPASFTITPPENNVITGVEIDFGDGTGASLGELAGPTSLSHPFRNPGVMTVTAVSTDSQGVQATTSTQVGVAPLQLVLTAQVAGQSASLTATPSTGAIIDRYEWDFGDGQTFVSTVAQVAHGYPSAAGTWIAQVRAVPFGNGTPATASVTVRLPAAAP